MILQCGVARPRSSTSINAHVSLCFQCCSQRKAVTLIRRNNTLQVVVLSHVFAPPCQDKHFKNVHRMQAGLHRIGSAALPPISQGELKFVGVGIGEITFMRTVCAKQPSKRRTLVHFTLPGHESCANTVRKWIVVLVANALCNRRPHKLKLTTALRRHQGNYVPDSGDEVTIESARCSEALCHGEIEGQHTLRALNRLLRHVDCVSAQKC